MRQETRNAPLRVASLFSGIGGIERGLNAAGHHADIQCELYESARAVLRNRFASSRLWGDIRQLKSIPTVDLVAAGFPCQDLSQAGRAQGIAGTQSSLISYVFDLIRRQCSKPEWILLENVPFMLQLERGNAMRHLTSEIQRLGYSWAYRVVDSRAFGLPQRRRRVWLLASRTNDPRNVLLSDDVGYPPVFSPRALAHGFYWTEGNTGLGWTNDGVPTLKGGSGLGIPSPPGIWLRDSDEIMTPDIRDAERLQGFPPNWTLPAMTATGKVGVRWKLVGNAVSVPVARWIGKRLVSPKTYDPSGDVAMPASSPWPTAAWSVDGSPHRANVSEWPKHFSYRSLRSFLKFPLQPLSERATAGFFRRIRASSLRRPAEFDNALEIHLSRFAAEDVLGYT